MRFPGLSHKWQEYKKYRKQLETLQPKNMAMDERDHVDRETL